MVVNRTRDPVRVFSACVNRETARRWAFMGSRLKIQDNNNLKIMFLDSLDAPLKWTRPLHWTCLRLGRSALRPFLKEFQDAY
jgi:hypothetical protein